MLLVRSLVMPVVFAVAGLISPLGREVVAAADHPEPWPVGRAAPPASEPAAKPLTPADPAPSRKSLTTARRAANGLFYVTGRIGGRSIRFVLDTGASHVVLTRHDARVLGLSPDGRRSARVRSSQGIGRMTWTRIPRIAIGGSRIDAVPAMIIEGGPPVSLLGQNLLARLNTLEIRGDVLTLG